MDESGAHLQMAPWYGRGYRKEWVYYPVAFNRGNRLTLISAISFEKIIAARDGEWSANGEIFLNFIERCICPMIKKDQVVVMDNVSFHHVIKNLLRKSAATNLVRFKKEIKLAFESVHSNELNHWFQHCGYRS
ncbi:MAG: transposase [Proteobacteria bacterium]|nr:transposase [Pseudomonadota bacterium]